MEITPGLAASAISAGVALGGGIAAWLRAVDAAQERRIIEVKGTQKTLFDKHDAVSHELQDYKLYVAEKYVNREILREQLLPINKALDSIQQELRDERHHKD